MQWADEVASSGRKFIIFGNAGGISNFEADLLTNKLLAHQGLKLGFGFVEDTFYARYGQVDEKMVGFERALPRILPGFDEYLVIDDRTKVHLSAVYRGLSNQHETPLISTHPNGAYIQSGYDFYFHQELNKKNWIINPFQLFETLFKDTRFPIPDATTRAGQRMYFSHIDGDGWNNVSFLDRYKGQNITSARVMLEELIRPYRDLPVTVGVVTGDFDNQIGGSAESANIAREIFAEPQVEVGSHTHSHPFFWGFYKKYSRKKEMEKIAQNRAINQKADTPGLVDAVIPTLKKATNREKNRDYIAGGAKAMPRAFMKMPFSLEGDLTGSMELAEALAPEGKKAMLMQWTGDTKPFEAAVRITREFGVMNINGGDPRYDLNHPSHIYLSPLSRIVGSERQIYAAASNENTYTNDWTGPYYGFKSLAETLDRTETPRRLKPFNLYYHTYSAEREAAIKAVLSHLDRARNGSYMPVPTSQYAAIANSFFSLTIDALSDTSWRISNRGAMQTMRFDKADDLAVDWHNSQFVIGATRHNGSLYIALDPAGPDAILTIKKRDSSLQQRHNHAYFERSRWDISAVSQSPCGVAFLAKGFGSGKMVWRSFVPGLYDMLVTRDNVLLSRSEQSVDDTGILTLDIKQDAISGLDIVIKSRQQPSQCGVAG